MLCISVPGLSPTDVLGQGTQPCSEAPGDLQVELEIALGLTLDEFSCLLISGPKLALGQPNNCLKSRDNPYIMAL